MTLDTIPGWSAEWGNAEQSIDWKGVLVQAQKDSEAAMQLIQALRSFGISTRFEANTQAALVTVNVGSGPGVADKEQRTQDAPAKPEVTNNCPNGICISGGTVNGNPTVNNNSFGSPKPPPHIEWSFQDKASILDAMLTRRGRGAPDPNPHKTVKVTLSDTFYYPLFAVRCDRPCTAIGVISLHPGQNSIAIFPGSQLLYTTNDPNVGIAGPAVPVLDRDSEVLITIRSADTDPITIIGVTTYVRP